MTWFAKSFNEFDPMIQNLHKNGGELSGVVNLEFGSGIAGVIGRKFGVKLGLPNEEGEHQFKVSILHKNGALHWIREFNSAHKMVSIFTPYGHYPTGYWKEVTGNLTLYLGVKIVGGGWYWEQKKMKFMGFILPSLLFPSLEAYKRVNKGKYEFSVTLALPIMGKLVSYNGSLTSIIKSAE